MVFTSSSLSPRDFVALQYFVGYKVRSKGQQTAETLDFFKLSAFSEQLSNCFFITEKFEKYFLIFESASLDSFVMSEQTIPSVDDHTDPFKGFKISNWEILDELSERTACPKCNKSRKYFCYTCYVPVPQLKDVVPNIKLPVKIDVIKHAKEIDGKSTAVHAAILAPDDVTIYTYPCIPNYSTEENVVLIFPGKNALTISEYLDQHQTRPLESDEGEPACKKEKISPTPISRAIFIDSTWNQSRGIYKDQRLKNLPCIVLQSRVSEFWRHQHGSPRWFLATIEAVHQFLVELYIHSESTFTTSKKCDRSGGQKPDVVLPVPTEAEKPVTDPEENPEKPPSKFVKNLALCRSGEGDDCASDVCLLGPEEWKDFYDGRYDNLLFFFRFMYSKIHKMYDHKKLRSYRRPMATS